MAQVNAGRVRFVAKGEYNNATQYYTFDLVNYNGNSYYAKENTLGNLPTDITKWQLIAEKGNQGERGIQGLTGNGIASIVKTSTSGLVDTYTITFTDGTTTTFEVTNGEDGEVTQAQLDETNRMVEQAKLVYNALPKVTGSGTDITLNDTAETPLGITLKGNTYQASEPSPDYPQDIQVVTGDNTIKVQNKNLFDKNNNNEIVNMFINYVSSPNNYNLLFGGKQKSVIISCEPNTTYTISKIVTFRFMAGYITTEPNNEVPVYGRMSNNEGTSITITTGENAKYLVVYCYHSDYDNNLQQILDSIQIEKGSTATNYVEHKEQNYPINLGTLELCKIPNTDYQDYFYGTPNNWYKKKYIKKAVLNGNEAFNLAERTGVNVFISSVFSQEIYRSGSIVVIISDYFIGSKDISGNVPNSIRANINGQTFIAIPTSNPVSASLETFKAWLSTHNTTVYYVLATPTSEPITDTTLIEQLNNLYYAYAYKDQTNISQENSNLASLMNAETTRDLSSIFELIQGTEL